MRTLVILALTFTVSTARAEPATASKLVDAVAVSRDGRMLVLPVEQVVDGGASRSSRSAMLVKMGATLGPAHTLVSRHASLPDEGRDEKEEKRAAAALDKLLAADGFALVPMVKPGKELAPGLAFEIMPGKSDHRVIATLAKKPLASASTRGNGTPELLGAVLVRGATPHVYALVRWSTSADGGPVEHTDAWVAIPVPTLK